MGHGPLLLERNIMTPRDKYLSAFKNGVYSQVLPWRMTNYIDGLFHHSMVCGAAYMAQDTEIWLTSKTWIERLLSLDIEARNFAFEQVTESWEPCGQYWIKRKPQSFAGPAALHWAIEHGAGVNSGGLDRPNPWFMIITGGVFGYLVKWVDLLSQHINSYFLAYMLEGKKPPKSMYWLAWDNPFYLWLYGEELYCEFPGRKTTEGKIVKSKDVPFRYREPDTWPIKNRPNRLYLNEGEEVNWEYTPICELFVDLLENQNV